MGRYGDALVQFAVFCRSVQPSQAHRADSCDDLTCMLILVIESLKHRQMYALYILFEETRYGTVTKTEQQQWLHVA